MAHIRHCIPLSILLLVACQGDNQGSISCGLAAMSGPLVALEGFAKGRALGAPPLSVPTTLPGRYVAGAAGTVTASMTEDGTVRASLDVPPAPRATPGYGALVIDEQAEPMGILIYDGATIPGATSIGTIVVGDSTRPLYGVRVTRRDVESPACPLFPVPVGELPE